MFINICGGNADLFPWPAKSGRREEIMKIKETYKMDIRSVVITVLLFSFGAYNAGLGQYQDIKTALQGTPAQAAEIPKAPAPR